MFTVNLSFFYDDETNKESSAFIYHDFVLKRINKKSTIKLQQRQEYAKFYTNYENEFTHKTTN